MSRDSWRLWAGVTCLVAAAAAVVIPGIGFVTAATDTNVPVDRTTTVKVEGGRAYGLYFDDPDNSGYSESCSVTDAGGREIPVRDAGASMSSSEFSNLDLEFTARGSEVTVDCIASGATASVGLVPNFKAMLLGGLLCVPLGAAGAVLVVRHQASRHAPARSYLSYPAPEL